jgi:mono/diheme cytochrome c family protein
MKRTIKVLLLISVVFTLWYCSAKVLPPTTSELIQFKQINPEVDTSSITKGYDIYARSCHKCHGLKTPGNFTNEEWNKILPTMAKRAKLTENEIGLVHNYVKMYSKKS